MTNKIEKLISNFKLRNIEVMCFDNLDDAQKEYKL